MGKLHENLAVEADLKTTAEKITQEGIDTFNKKDDHFRSLLREYLPDNENEPKTPVEEKPMVETVKGKLRYIADVQIKYLNCLYQKEITNQLAKSDIVLEDGVVLARNVPATMLLSLESKLKRTRQLYESIPTLLPGEKWEKDPHSDNFIALEEKIRTKKVYKNHVKSAATDKHPAQIETYQEDERTGIVKTTKQSSMLTPKEKSVLLGRIDQLIQAIKQARMRANSIEIPQEARDADLGGKIYTFITNG